MINEPVPAILIIEDDKLIRGLLVSCLTSRSFKVFEAENGQEGLEVFYREKPDLVLTDLWMPVMDGYAVVEELTFNFPDTPVLVMSGAGKLVEAIRAVHLGCWDYIIKPIESIDAMIISIKRMLERARLLRENRAYQHNLETLVAERTRQVQATQGRLVQAHKLASIGMLASGIAHEINNPNNYIAFNAEIIADIWRDALPILTEYAAKQPADFALGNIPFNEIPETTARLLSGLSDGSRRISTIISQLKQYARPSSDARPEGFDINKTLANAVTLMDHVIRRTTNCFIQEPGAELPMVKGVPQQIEQVLVNLISNALQALPGKEKSVVVRTWFDTSTNEIAVGVSDEGIGMSPETLERLMEPFFSTRHDAGGTGLGLSICDTIIQEHGGSLTFESKPGEGTQAIVRLKPVATTEG